MHANLNLGIAHHEFLFNLKWDFQNSEKELEDSDHKNVTGCNGTV
jgi:hypothetical protein